MGYSDLEHFKDHFNASDYFVGITESLIDKLLEYEYISSFKLPHYIHKLTNNISELRIDTNNPYEYKTGYYDANKKELYIKNTKNVPATYLRLLYALTTTEVDNNVYETGYATTKLSTENYKLCHYNFGINRAIMSNLVYKLCNLVPSSLQIMETRQTTTHNFLGFKIESQNDMYFLEGKLLSELCYVLDLDPEVLYNGLFTRHPMKILNKAFKKKKFERAEDFLIVLDNISRKYSTYNKLVFLSQKLNDNYVEYKKNVLTSDVNNIHKEQALIEQEIADVLAKLKRDSELIRPTEDEENEIITEDMDEACEYTSGLAETIQNLYDELREQIIYIQDILAEQFIESSKHLSYTLYASRLKCFNDLLIVPNQKLSDKIEEIIMFKLMPESEVTGSNLIDKIKYALIEQILAEKDYSDISNTFSFYNIDSLESAENGSSLIILNSSTPPSKILEISGLDTAGHNYTLTPIPIDNLSHIMNTGYSAFFVGNIERLYTDLKNNFKKFSNVPLDQIYVFEYDSKKYLLIHTGNEPQIVSFATHAIRNFVIQPLSEKYKVFGKSVVKTKNKPASSLPTLYKSK